MAKTNKVGIVGGGRFGLTLAEALSANGIDVTLVDKNWDIVQGLADSPVRAVQGDASNPAVLRDAGFGTCDIAVVAIGSALEASTLATINCKDLRIPRVVAKAGSPIHGRVLSRVGADNVIYPDRDRAYRLAESILRHNPIDLYEIADGYSVAEIAVPPAVAGKTIAESDVRHSVGVTILVIRRMDGDEARPRVSVIPTGTEVLHPEDRLVVFGPDKALEKLAD